MKPKLLRTTFIFCICAVTATGASANSLKGLLDEVKDRNKAESADIRESTRGDKPREHYIDPYRQLREEKRKLYSSKCNLKDFKNFPLYSKCFDQAMAEYRTEFPDRGTDEYGSKFYSGLNKMAAKDKRDELVRMLDHVSFFSKPGNEETELTIDHLTSEIMYIERYVMEIPPRDYRPIK